MNISQDQKIEKINDWYKSYERKKLENEDIVESLIDKLYDLMFLSKEFNEDELTDSNELFYFGKYYDIIKDYDKMKKYYLKAIELNNNNAMYNLGYYYQRVEKNYDLMKKYYLKAIEFNNYKAMWGLGYYYDTIEIDYDLMKKYYMMAIELNNNNSMYNLGRYYQFVEYNCDLMKKYYKMAIKLNNKNAMNNLGVYYQNLEKNYNLMKKYYTMAVIRGNKMAIENFNNYYLSKTDYSFLELYDCDNFKECFTELINKKFTCDNIINLPENYKKLFLKLDFTNNENISAIVIIKQNIYKLTLIFPSNYNSEYMEQFRAIESIVQNNECTILNKDLLLHITGRLFI